MQQNSMNAVEWFWGRIYKQGNTQNAGWKRMQNPEGYISETITFPMRFVLVCFNNTFLTDVGMQPTYIV